MDKILLQWYSGFDATLCHNSGDPTACACNNVPDADCPNVLDSDKDVGGLLMASSGQSASGKTAEVFLLVLQ